MLSPHFPGKVLTFYDGYEVGVGRSLALCSIGWLLAASGRRVLVIDSDFDNPSVHKYDRPFFDAGRLRSGWPLRPRLGLVG